MSRHRLLHLAIDTARSEVSQCDCLLQYNHPLTIPYRSCGECGAVYATEYTLVQSHLARTRSTSADDHHAENIHHCPGCAHGW